MNLKLRNVYRTETMRETAVAANEIQYRLTFLSEVMDTIGDENIEAPSKTKTVVSANKESEANRPNHIDLLSNVARVNSYGQLFQPADISNIRQTYFFYSN